MYTYDPEIIQNCDRIFPGERPQTIAAKGHDRGNGIPFEECDLMTTQSAVESRCAVCGKASTQGIITSTNAFGSPDLDLRPPSMERYTIDHWVQECPHCGYCASEIDELIAGAAEMIESEEYRTILNNPDKHDSHLISQFLCASALFEHAGLLVEAAQSALYAAWATDDADGAGEEAVRARKRILQLIDELHARGEHMEKDPVSETMRMIDVARRAGEFDQANRLIAELANVEDPLFRTLVAFQGERVQAGDTKAYTVKEAIPDPSE